VGVLVVLLLWQNNVFAQAAVIGDQTALVVISPQTPLGSEQPISEAVPEPIVEPSPVEDYLNAIDRASIEGGTYSIALADLYLGLGLSLLNEEKYGQAKEAFQQGMQVERITNGLYSPEQIPYLFSIAEIDQKLGENKELKKVLQTIYQINTSSYGPEDDRRLPVLNRLFEWYLSSYYSRIMAADYYSLLVSAQLAVQMANIVEVNHGLEDPGTVSSLRTVSHVNYLIVDHLNTYGEPDDADFMSNNASNRSLGQDTAFVRSSVHYRQGIDALSRVIEGLDLQQRPAVDYAEAIAELGDWYLLFGQKQSAARTYQLAFQALQKEQQSAELEEALFGQPRQIGFIETLPEPEPEETERVTVSMRVLPTGAAKNIAIIDAPEEIKASQLRKLKKSLRSKRFRPRLIAGEPQLTENFVIDYPLPR
jgi:tetratricopeptide (TPR) repeat protein